MNSYINFNGKILRSDRPVIHADNRGFRYGDGVFETIRVIKNRIIFSDFHFERLFSGIKLLQFDVPASFTESKLSHEVESLCKKNKDQLSARVRLVVFRSDGSLSDPRPEHPDYIIQSASLPPINSEIKEKGLVLGLYPESRKSLDIFSNLKSNNYLLYVMAARYAKTHQYGDCLVLNTSGRVCESTIANIFCIKNAKIYTPPLSEGCVAGVTRRFLLEKMRNEKYPIEEKQMDLEFVESSEEIFLTNAINGIRWVDKLGERRYDNKITRQLYQQLASKIS